LLAEVQAALPVPNWLHVVPEGDHSLMTTKRRLRAEGITQADVDREIAAEVARFVEAAIGRKGVN
jgi:hypothetical protein